MLCRTVTTPADPAMPAIERIYTEAFPISERRPVSWLHETTDREDFTLLIAEQDETVVGFATVFIPPEPGDIALLDYLAVAPSYRGGGVGGHLFQAALARAGNRPVLIEVETVGDPLDPIRQRRQAFYRRHGCRRILGVSYLLPIPTVDKPPMELMIANPPDELSKPQLSRWLTTIYTRVYNCDAADARLAVMLTDVLETPALV
jgi:ribosomal protein S18 acetylase RimI-like enzyme